MKNKSRFKLLGFTLIELLFVIAIVSVLASLGLSMVKQRTQQAKIEKTALQMQQLMQAGLAYYVDNHCWPNGAGPSSNPGCMVNPARFDGYIPINGITNPWGQTYNYGLAPDKTNMFEVAVATPDPNVAGNAPIAQRIAGMLPNAGFGIDSPTVTAQLCPVNNCVYAQATLPAQAASQQGFTLVAMGEKTLSSTEETTALSTDDKQTWNITCPVGNKGTQTILSIRAIDYIKSYEDNASKFVPVIPKYTSLVVSSSCPKDVSGFIRNCDITVYADSQGMNCAVSSAQVIGDKAKIWCNYHNITEGEHPNAHSITYQYEAYCCVKEGCT